MNPFDLPGPQFLVLFGLLIALAFTVVIGLRVLVAGGGSGDAGLPDPVLDPYEAACLAGGRPRLALLAVATLVDRGHAVLKGRALTYARRRSAKDLHAVEAEFLAARPSRASAARRAVAGAAGAIEAALEAERLTVGRDAAMLYRAAGVVATIVVALVGGTKAYLGLQRGRPIEYLLMMLAASVALLVWVTAQRPPLTSRGRRVLRSLQVERPRAGLGAAAPALSNPAAAMSVALWGLPALAAYPAYAELRQQFGNNAGGGGDGGGSSDSSCSGGDSGGGSSCGGGCGGCGGD